jgi:hypothetical protein
MPVKSRTFRPLQEKQIGPDHQQWIVMINAGSKNWPLAFRSDLVLDCGPQIIRRHLCFLTWTEVAS